MKRVIPVFECLLYRFHAKCEPASFPRQFAIRYAAAIATSDAGRQAGRQQERVRSRRLRGSSGPPVRGFPRENANANVAATAKERPECDRHAVCCLPWRWSYSRWNARQFVFVYWWSAMAARSPDPSSYILINSHYSARVLLSRREAGDDRF